MSEPIGALHHVGVVVRNLDESEAFAIDALGFSVIQRIESQELGIRASFLDCGQGVIELVQLSDPAVAEARLGGSPARLDHIGLTVPDLQLAVEALAGRGVRTVSETPIVLPNGGRTHFTTAESSGGVAWQLLESPNAGTERVPGHAGAASPEEASEG